jgi:hypothetical protein
MGVPETKRLKMVQRLLALEEASAIDSKALLKPENPFSALIAP